MRITSNRKFSALICTVLCSLLIGAGSWTDIKGFSGHPFYVSVTQIHFNQTTRTFQISVRIFSDDLEKTIQDLTEKRLRLGSPKEHPESDAILRDYFSKHFKIRLTEVPIQLQFLGKEVELETTWCYLESEPIIDSLLLSRSKVAGESSGPVPDRIFVTNRILFDSFPQQTNVVHINVGKQRKSLLLNHAKRTDSVHFEDY